jgi:hypothetical protein
MKPITAGRRHCFGGCRRFSDSSNRRTLTLLRARTRQSDAVAPEACSDKGFRGNLYVVEVHVKLVRNLQI